MKSPLMLPIQYEGQIYFTSQYFHSQYKANAGEKYSQLKDFNRLIRSIEAYPNYIEKGDIVELNWQVAKQITSADFAPVFESISYNPIMLINATAQVALTHHLDDEISKQVSVSVNTNATKEKTPSIENKSAVQLKLIASEYKAALAIAKLLGLDGNQAKISAGTLVRNTYGVDILAGLQLELKAESLERVITPTEIGKMLGLTAVKTNQLLEERGLQVSYVSTNGSKLWRPTETGMQFAVLIDSAKRHSDGSMIQQLKWKSDVISSLSTHH